MALARLLWVNSLTCASLVTILEVNVTLLHHKNWATVGKRRRGKRAHPGSRTGEKVCYDTPTRAHAHSIMTVYKCRAVSRLSVRISVFAKRHAIKRAAARPHAARRHFFADTRRIFLPMAPSTCFVARVLRGTSTTRIGLEGQSCGKKN